jgi:hypothetical protein
VSLASLLATEGIGRAILVDMSLDNFVTMEARYADKAGLYGGSPTSRPNAQGRASRVLSLSPVRRGFGQSRVATSATCELVLDNADGGLDWLCGRPNIATAMKVRIKLYLALYEVSNPVGTADTRSLGTFMLSEPPRRDDSKVTLQLGDDIMGRLAEAASLPTLDNWAAVGTTANNPLKNGYGRPDVLDGEESTPVQLAFGEDWVRAFPHLIPLGTVDAAYQNKVIVPICCTTDAGAASSTEITALRINWAGTPAVPGGLYDVPRTVTSGGGAPTTVWSVERSPSITVGSKTFKIIYLVVRADLGNVGNMTSGLYWLFGGKAVDRQNPATGTNGAITYESTDFANEWQGGYPPTAVYKMRDYASNNASNIQYGNAAAGVTAWYVQGFPLSARTHTVSAVQHATDVLTDLATHYSDAAVTVDAVSRGRIRRGCPNAACAGVVAPWTDRRPDSWYRPPSLRAVITALAQSSDIDVFINNDGLFAFSSDVRDFTIATQAAALIDIPETQVRDVVDDIPGDGERFSPANRIFFTGGKIYEAEGMTMPAYAGPFDFATLTAGAGIALADRIIEAKYEQGWRPYRQQARSPFGWRTSIDTEARPRIRFKTNIRVMLLDLGSYFAFTWTRGPSIGGPYAKTWFQIEGLTYASGDDSVEIEAIWRQDASDERQYLLDDETLLVRSKGVLTGSASTDGSDLVEFTGTINLTTMGVQVGDILILRDSTQADDVFTRNAAFRIVTISATFQVTVVDETGAAAAIPTGIVINADWSIQRGATTYPTAISDPSNYPSGGAMYGKVTNASGTTSDTATGNRLISG